MTRVHKAFCPALAVALVLGGARPAVAQIRDVQRPAVGTASISGVVTLDAPSPRPIRRVLVQLTDLSSGRSPIAAITDDNGAFLFPDLPAGTYTLVASRAAYVTSAYGSKTYGRGSGVPMTVAAGQQVRDIAIKMIRGAAIAGTLRDQSGRPAANAEILVLMARSDGSRRRLVPIPQSGHTNSRGEYRIFGLAPGSYLLRAQPPFRMGELRETTSADLEWARRAAAAPAGTAEAPPAEQPVAYAASYYPGTSEAASASLVTVAAGEERLGVDFSFSLVPTATVSGRLVGPDGQPPKNALASVEPLGSESSAIDMLMAVAQTGSTGGLRVGADGRFSVSGIQPGRYRVTVRGAPSTAPANPMQNQMAGLAALAPGMAGGMGSTLWAREEVTIAGRDISNLDLQLQEGLTMSGTVVFEGQDPQTPTDPTNSAIMLQSADRETTSAIDMVISMISGMTPGRASKDGTFKVAGVVPGRYRFVASPPGTANPFGSSMIVGPGGWVLKSAMWKGRDISDGTIDIQTTDDLSGVVITFTKAVTEISGRILDAAGHPAPGFPIVVFSTNPSDWVAGSRRVTSAKPSSDGTYHVRGLPTGEYFVCALSDLDPNDLYDAAFLEQLAASSFKLTLGEGEKKTQDLKLGGGQ